MRTLRFFHIDIETLLRATILWSKMLYSRNVLSYLFFSNSNIGLYHNIIKQNLLLNVSVIFIFDQ